MTSTTHTGAIDAGAVEKAAGAIFDVIWPLQDWDGSERICRLASRQAAKSALAALATPSPTASSETSDLAEENKLLREALESVPLKPGVTMTSGEWAADDKAQGWSDAFHTRLMRSCRSKAYAQGYEAGKLARAALRASKGTESPPHPETSTGPAVGNEFPNNETEN